MATKDLGAVTAYAYAKDHGYTGTEEEFEAKMAALPQAVTDAQAAVTRVTGIGAQATRVATTAPAAARYNSTTNKIEFDIPAGNGIDSIDLTKTEGAVKTYTITFDDGSKTTFNVTDGEVTNEELERDYARKDGQYDDMTVGTAKQLTGDKYVEDEALYSFRKTGGDITDVNDREYLDQITGGTVCWNQLFDISTFGAVVACTKSYDSTTRTVTITPTDYSSNSIGFYTTKAQLQSTVNHVYLTSVDILPDNAGLFRFGFEGAAMSIRLNGGSYQTITSIAKLTRVASCTLYLASQDWTAGVYKYKNVRVFDLTQMFGSTIADAIYALEQATPGAGVAWFKKYFLKDYYAYDAGSLQSVSVSKHKMTGKNLFDGIIEEGTLSSNGTNAQQSGRYRSKNFISIKPGNTYILSIDGVGKGVNYWFYDKNKVGIASDGGARMVAPSNAYYLRFFYDSTILNANIQLELGSTATDYEPYKAHSYSMDSSLELRGIPKLTTDNELTYDGDVYQYDGTVKRKYGIVDLGAINWGYSNGYFRTNDLNDTIKRSSSQTVAANAICSIYSVKEWNSDSDKAILIRNLNTNEAVLVKDTAYTDAASFKTAMSGVMLVYELATPTTELAKPYAQVQVCDKNGTEEFIDAKVETSARDVTLPVLASTRYPEDLKSKLENLPTADQIGAQSIVDTASGDIASFTDGAKDIPMQSLNVNIEPVQDLHGYDHPWPGGVGKNKLPLTVNNIKNANSSVTWSGNEITKSGVKFTIETDNNGNVQGIKLNGTAASNVQFLLGLGLTFNGNYILNGGLSSNISVSVQGKGTSSGGDIAFTDDGATSRTSWIYVENGTVCNDIVKPMVRRASETGATYASYSNICPISGRTEVVTQRTGVNVWDEEWRNGYYSPLNGVFTSSPNFIANVNPIIVNPLTDYYLCSPQGIMFEVFGYNSDGEYISRFSSNQTTGLLTIPQNVHYINWNTRTSGAITTYNHDISINYPSTDTEYHAYQGTTYTTSLSQTVYGGKLDVVSGKLVVDKAMEIVDASKAESNGTLPYGAIQVLYKPLKEKKYGTAVEPYYGLSSNRFNASTSNNEGIINGRPTNGNIYFNMPSSATTIELVKQWFTDNPTQFCYELANPQTIQLTPQEVRTLLAVNNVWSDSGSVEVTYTADPKLYIDKKFEEIKALINS